MGIKGLGGRALAAAAVTLAFAGAVAPGEARADRCNPEELVGQEPILFGEDEGPVCYVMLNVVYPRLACDATTMNRCINTLQAGETWRRNNGGLGTHIAGLADSSGVRECATISFSGNKLCVSDVADLRMVP